MSNRPYSKSFSKPSRTKQSHRAEANINSLVSRYGIGQLAAASMRHAGKGSYLDVSSVRDYQSCLNIVNNAEDLFLGLPSSVRKRFGNDPVNFVDFCFSPDTSPEELKALGLAMDGLPDERAPNTLVEAGKPGKASGSDKNSEPPADSTSAKG